nr:pullulanase-type alpha-1,6-glucosidase [Nocardioides perillae]
MLSTAASAVALLTAVSLAGAAPVGAAPGGAEPSPPGPGAVPRTDAPRSATTPGPTSYRSAARTSDEVTAADRDLVRAPVRGPLTRERFYFVMADRFANGDPTNDRGGIEGGRLDHGFDPTDKGFFHGGDLAGMRERLDYVEGLGTTAIWLTPSFANKPVQGSGDQASAGYHGYWVTDFTRLDPHFGTNAELKAFVDDAHRRGIKVFFDIITNHTADVLDYREQQYGYVDKATQPYRDADGEAFDDRDFAGGDTFPELDAETSFPRTPVFRTEADETVKVPAWLNDPRRYHNRGDSTFAGESSTYGDFVGLDDLFTEQPEVVDGMTEIYEEWVRFGIDGFRIDTVKHVNLEFWQEFAPAIRAEAARIGNDDFFAFGEVFDSAPSFMSTYTTEGEMDATLDFGFQSAATAFATGSGTTRLRDLFADDDWYTDADSSAYSLPTFLGNHDMGRIASFLDDAASGDELLARDRLAHDLMFLVRGQPVVYYGDEQGFTGPGGDKDARQDMFPTRTAEYADDDQVGTDATPADDNFDPTHPLYRRIAALSELRERHPALADGAQLHRYASDRAGVYAFSRVDREERRELVVAVNNAEEARTVSFDTLRERGGFRQVWPAGASQRLKADDEGRVTLTVPPLSSVVFRADGRLPEREAAPAVALVRPLTTDGAPGTVASRAEVRAQPAEPGFHEVTFAWRETGAQAWEVLGTDDTAPYRVRHDVRDLPVGTEVEYRAVLRDHSGNLSAAGAPAVVAEEGSAPAPTDPGPGTPDGPVEQPGAVSVPGSFNQEVGCPGDWQPDCDAVQLTRDAADDVWKATLPVPAGTHEYKAAIDRSWTENYGAGGAPNGPNLSLTTGGSREVRFFYDHRTHHVTSDAQGPVVTAPGSFQSELGCPGDWSPACMRSWLQDPDGDGVLTFATTRIPPGTYEVKAAHGLSWDENYGAGGAPGGANIGFTVGAAGQEVLFRYVLETKELTVLTQDAGPRPDLTAERAHWLRDDVVALDVPDDAPAGSTWRLHASPDGRLVADAETLDGPAGATSVPLTLDPAGLPADVVADFPHLADLEALRLRPADARRADELLRGQLAVASYDPDGRLTAATGVQVPGVLDDVYVAQRGADRRELGPTWTGATPSLALWAPTAQDVDLLLWPAGQEQAEPRRVAMTRQRDGAWTVRGEKAWRGASYLFDVRVWAPEAQQVVANRVTDPASLALTTNSQRSVLVDLDDPALAPAGWGGGPRPTVERAVDRSIYEQHVRDFSIGDETVPAADRGRYRAFTHTGSDGMRHLRRLAEAGLTTVHLLPTFDIATIEERRPAQAEPACDLAALPADSERQQECVGEVAGQDGFNWGYDPFHYTTPEGSYASDPEGPTRTREFRAMVQGLHRAGLEVVLDVVYNHTAASGQDAKSVLDRVVPGYYHRLDATGAVETSTCCANTATEHAMAEKLMVDSVVTWARDYAVDGFRFDLMGHHSKANVLAVRAALDELTVARDGVDGRRIGIYGEGWNFGEVADDARFEQATQANLAGTGIGTFSDRLRDAVRGGGPFDEDPGVQGFGSGLLTDPNDREGRTPAEQERRLRQETDLVALGMAGNLADFRFRSAAGGETTGREVDYNGSPAGYAAEPGETVTYVDAHDNETLYDAFALKLPQGTSPAERVRANTVALSTVALGQGTAFWHAGTDLLRSKSLDRNSYDSGDWFNRVDWSRREHTFGSGLPPRRDNEAKWGYLRPLLGDPALRMGQAEMSAAHEAALDLLRLRTSSRLFRLGTAAAVQEKVSFLEAPLGTVAMLLDDTVGGDVDPAREGLLVLVNPTPDPVTVTGTGAGWRLHAAQRRGADEVVRGTQVRADEVVVPARTTAVLER